MCQAPSQTRKSDKVIMGCRSLKRGEEARDKIVADAGRKGVAEVWQLDLGTYSSIQDFVEKVQGLERLDAIVENASVALLKKTLNEGLETSLTVNVIGTILFGVLGASQAAGDRKEIWDSDQPDRSRYYYYYYSFLRPL
ncbi:hypothetical protein K402DRAFT_115444 [Aulographum hederae CBS 113979]|uniref:NAD(P)-binding protein n=1 Tax=Aulographum hederae CBS 113979 TaxID=1176131 RepID=A0A6G1GW63_9PEZI|nr:hypothetical protein K402DRAFT_115444 [Aulographum hederae CBS 113979]